MHLLFGHICKFLFSIISPFSPSFFTKMVPCFVSLLMVNLSSTTTAVVARSIKNLNLLHCFFSLSLLYFVYIFIKESLKILHCFHYFLIHSVYRGHFTFIINVLLKKFSSSPYSMSWLESLLILLLFLDGFVFRFCLDVFLIWPHTENGKNISFVHLILITIWHV